MPGFSAEAALGSRQGYSGQKSSHELAGGHIQPAQLQLLERCELACNTCLAAVDAPSCTLCSFCIAAGILLLA